MKERHIELNIKGIITFTLDTMAKAVYVRFTNEKVEKTEQKDDNLIIDYDKTGKHVGIEIIRLKKLSGTIKQVIKDTEESLPKKLREEVAPYLKAAMA